MVVLMDGDGMCPCSQGGSGPSAQWDLEDLHSWWLEGLC